MNGFRVRLFGKYSVAKRAPAPDAQRAAAAFGAGDGLQNQVLTDRIT
jgi:hypothetical protein